MFNGDCYPNGSYINHIYITPDPSYYISHLQCVLPDSTLSGGEWINPNGQPATVPTILTTILFVVLNLIILLISLYIDLTDKHLMNTNQMRMIMSSSVVYPVVVLILLPTSSLFIYSVSYISLY